jgi:hypothetical protein
MNSPDLTEPMWLSRIAPAAGGFAVVVGLLTLAGYALREPMLVSVLPGSVPMAPSTAVLFVLMGVSLGLVAPHGAGAVRRRTGQCLAVLVVLIAAAILLQYVLGRGLGLDQVLFADQARAWSASATPGRFSPHTGVAFIVTGLAMALLDADAGHGYRYARVLTAAVALVAGIGLTGRAFGLQCGVDTKYLPHCPNDRSGLVLLTGNRLWWNRKWRLHRSSYQVHWEQPRF